MALRCLSFQSRLYGTSLRPTTVYPWRYSWKWSQTQAWRAHRPLLQARSYMPPRRRPSYQRFNGGRILYEDLYKSGKLPYVVIVVVGTGVVFYAYHLETVPVSERRRFNLFKRYPNFEAKIAEGEYQNILRQFSGRILHPQHPYSIQARRVLERLLPVSGLQDLNWKVHVVHDPEQINAFVIPGGKVFVFTGLLKVTQDDNGLATVLSHEISHTFARHVAERVSKSIIGGTLALVLAILGDVSLNSANIINRYIIELPNSRQQESEADEIGLLMMARACYNVEAARSLWQRMEKQKQFAVPKLLSTHPTDKDRIAHFERILPRAIAAQNASGCGDIDSNETARFFEQVVRPQKSGTATEKHGTGKSNSGDDWFW